MYPLLAFITLTKLFCAKATLLQSHTSVYIVSESSSDYVSHHTPLILCPGCVWTNLVGNFTAFHIRTPVFEWHAINALRFANTDNEHGVGLNKYTDGRYYFKSGFKSPAYECEDKMVCEIILEWSEGQWTSSMRFIGNYKSNLTITEYETQIVGGKLTYRHVFNGKGWRRVWFKRLSWSSRGYPYDLMIRAPTTEIVDMELQTYMATFPDGVIGFKINPLRPRHRSIH